MRWLLKHTTTYQSIQGFSFCRFFSCVDIFHLNCSRVRWNTWQHTIKLPRSLVNNPTTHKSIQGFSFCRFFFVRWSVSIELKQSQVKHLTAHKTESGETPDSTQVFHLNCSRVRWNTWQHTILLSIAFYFFIRSGVVLTCGEVRWNTWQHTVRWNTWQHTTPQLFLKLKSPHCYPVQEFFLKNHLSSNQRQRWNWMVLILTL